MRSATFSVDTSLFHELGKLLVGRDSTALIELLKNSYDADATSVQVYGESMGDPGMGTLVVTDDGIGMTMQVLTKGFLTIGSRAKQEGDGRSELFERRFTGEKGIGRLAAHKLAEILEVESIPHPEVFGRKAKGVRARIDWKAIENAKTFDRLKDSGAIEIGEFVPRSGAAHGTRIMLQRLRKRWSDAELERFFREVQTFSPPDVLVRPPASDFAGDLLLDHPKVRDSRRADPGFAVELLGDLDSGEEYVQTLASKAAWLLEIDAKKSRAGIDFCLTPTKGFASENKAKQASYRIDFPRDKSVPAFAARILIRHGKTWPAELAGVRVLMEGFRVLPYGERGDDWLEIDLTYTKRERSLKYLGDISFDDSDPSDKDVGLSIKRNANYFGAVFLTREASTGLEMLVNREGFLPTEPFLQMRQIIQTGIDLSIRVQASVSHPERVKKQELRKIKAGAATLPEIRKAVADRVKFATLIARSARRMAGEGQPVEAAKLIDKAAREFTEAGGLSELMLTEPGMTRMLAAIGTQMAAFVHEIRATLGVARSIERTMSAIRKTPGLKQDVRKKIAEVASSSADLRRLVERQAAYLTDIATPDSRRRRSRQRVAERIASALRFLAVVAEERGVQIQSHVPETLKTPPMFPAEVTLIFSNLLTNAIKACEEDGRVEVSAQADGKDTIAWVQNTGVPVDVEDSERWFSPFESTTTELDPFLGQGMGMGLPIVRNILEEYGSTVHFVEPDDDFSTAVEVRFKG